MLTIKEAGERGADKIEKLIDSESLAISVRAIPLVVSSFHRRAFGQFPSTKFAMRSVIASFVSVAFLTVTWVVLFENEARAYFNSEGTAVGISVLVAMAVVANAIPDLIAMAVTAWLLRRIVQDLDTGAFAWSNAFRYVALDICVTGALASFVAIGIGKYLYEESITASLQSALTFRPIGSNANGYAIGIFFWSTFATSIWILLCFSLLLVFSLMVRLVSVQKFFTKIVGNENREGALRLTATLFFAPFLFITGQSALDLVLEMFAS